MDCRAELDVLLAVPSAQSACGMGIDMKRERILKFTTPASIWQEAFPIGNGRLGAFVYGGTDVELLRINEDTLWSGYPGDEQTGMTKDAIDQARELAKQGRYREADALLKESNKGARDVQIYEPFGDLVLTFEKEREITAYERSLDLDTACVNVTYRDRDNAFEETCFASAPAQEICLRICAEKPFTVKISAENGFLTEQRYETDGFALFGRLPGKSLRTVGSGKGEVESFVFSEIPEEMGMRYEGRGRVRTAGGTTEAQADGLVCKDVLELEIFLAVRSSYAGADRHPETEGADTAALLETDLHGSERSFEVLKREHIAEYQELFNRVELELPESGREQLDLRERILQYEKDPDDTALESLVFDFGRYLLISCSRPGSQPANLQGLWNCEKLPPWHSDYTVNINTEMNYWMTGPCRLHELIEPLVRMNRELLDNGKQTAKTYFGCDGAACFHNVDLWRKTSPADGSPSWAFWPFGAAWMCRNLFDEYLFTKNNYYLREIFLILEENVRFCYNVLEKTPDGYAVCPATSPENMFLDHGEKTSIGLYTENTLAIIRNLFRDYLEACDALKRESDAAGADSVSASTATAYSNSAAVFPDAVLSQSVREILPKIVPTKIGSKGQILEWNEEFEESEPHHRHLSHLYEFHPGRGITNRTPELYSAVKESLTERGDETTGWSMAWKMLMWARLEEGTHIDGLMRLLFRLNEPRDPKMSERGGVYANLLCAHPPFQMDGNFGYTAGIAELLVQSHADEIVILPALPGHWTKGSVKGLGVRGNVCVDITWDEEKTECTLISSTDQKRTVRIKGGIQKEISLTAGKAVSFGCNRTDEQVQ